MFLHYGVGHFERLGSEIMNRQEGGGEVTFIRRFVTFFGVTPTIANDAWRLVGDYCNLPKDIQPKHLLSGMMHLKVYATETVLASLAKVDEKTFRKWSKIVRFILAEQLHTKVITLFFNCFLLVFTNHFHYLNR